MRERRLNEIRERVELVKRNFARLVEDYDARAPFVREGQLEYHRRTIAARFAAGSATAALDDDAFLALLHTTLQKWGIGTRASRLAPLESFTSSLRSFRSEIASLDRLELDDPSLPVETTTTQIWSLIERMAIVDNNAPLVASAKALHHVLPQLVVPMDREYTQAFFGWHNPEFQYQQRTVFTHAFSAFADIARSTNPQRFVRDSGWNTSRTKVIDNAIVSLMVLARASE